MPGYFFPSINTFCVCVCVPSYLNIIRYILMEQQVSRAESALVSKTQSSFIIKPSLSEKVVPKHCTCSSLLNACLDYIKAEHFQ